MSVTAQVADLLTQGQIVEGIRRELPMRSSDLAALASSLLAGEPDVDSIVARLTKTLGRSWRWLRPLACRYQAAFPHRPAPRRRNVIQFLLEDDGFQEACATHRRSITIKHWLTGPPLMQPVKAAESWAVPIIESVGALADWLEVQPFELDWFADLKRLAESNHYHYRLLTKKSGTVRMIESPKSRLKEIQHRILKGVLDAIPPHSAAHGFVKGRSISLFAQPHVGQWAVLRMDLRDFFPSCPCARVQAIFRTIGYPESVADLLGGLCTNVTPRNCWNTHDFDVDRRQLREARDLFSRPHLPQGAPTSPALANACFYRADCRLAGLARSMNLRYTRYADDLAFSGDKDFGSRAQDFSVHVGAILLEEGFSVNHRKTRVMRQGVRQHLAGLVTNQRVNVIRADFDQLKAILTNCVRFGPQSQNREDHPAFRAHLEGRVAFVNSINPVKARRLTQILRRIDWQ